MPLELILQPTLTTLTTTIPTTQINPDLLTTRLHLLFDASGCPEDAEACVVLTDDEEIHALNQQWRGVDKPTDVLAFAMQEGEPNPEHAIHLLGDIIISVPTALRQANEQTHAGRLGLQPDQGWTLCDELTFLAIHGLLHLLGHDHAEPEEEATMRSEEQRIWNALVHAHT